MAGFVATVRQWDVLEPLLEDVMRRYSVPVLHTKAFKATTGVFGGWSRLKKRSFVEELFTAAHGRMYGVSFSVRRREHAEQQKRDASLRPMSPYGVCFSSIMMEILRQPQMGADVRQRGIEFLIEGGNKNDGGIRSFFDVMAANPAFGGCLKSLSFLTKTSCRAIQLADFFAFYSRRHAVMSDRFDGKLALPADWHLEAISRHVPQKQFVVTGSTSTGERIGDLPEFSPQPKEQENT